MEPSSLVAAVSTASEEDIRNFFATLPEQKQVELLKAMALAPLAASPLPAGLYGEAITDGDAVRACVAKFDSAGTVYQGTLMRPCIQHWAMGPEDNTLLAMRDGSFYCSQTRPSLLSGGKVKPGGLKITGSGRILSIQETLDPEDGATWIFKVSGGFEVTTDGKCANPMIHAAAQLPLEEMSWSDGSGPEEMASVIKVIKEGTYRLPRAEHEFRISYVANLIATHGSKPFAECVQDFLMQTIAQSAAFAEEDYFGFLTSARRQGFPYVKLDEEEHEKDEEEEKEEEEEE